MSAVDDLRADVERVIEDHSYCVSGPICSCGWSDFAVGYTAHVSERVMAMLVEKWGLTEDRVHARLGFGTGWTTRLVTDWRTDTDSAEGDVRRAATQVAQHPVHDDTDEGDEG